MSDFVEKFPTLVWMDKPIIWDTRQEVSGPHWCVLLEDRGSHHTSLRKRSGAHSVGADSQCKLQVPHPGLWLAERAAGHYGNPTLQLDVYGITGTNGKTTSVAMLRHILASIFPQELVAELGTLGLRIWRGSELIEAFDTGFTTPEAPTLQHLCARLLDRSVRRLVMEVSSHALSLGRVGSVHFRSVGFTNLSQDHLDFHGSMEAYFDAKKSLFTTYFSNSRQPERWAVVHAAKPWGQRLVSELPLSTELHAFDWGRSSGFESQKLAGIEVWDYRFPGKFFAPVLGSFNAENALCALLMATRGGQIPVSPGVLTGFPGVPGRLERVSNPNGVNIVVDYAHTPDALQRSLQTLRHLLSADQKLWVVFGCGGDRDKAKRPAMGGIAESLADFVILTSDNPRSEDAAQILNEIRVGFKKWDSARHQSVADRRQAIGIALAQSDPKDLVLIAGRGHESVQEIQGVKVPFHDPTVARELLQTRA